ncbi:MAG: potassium transporter TrkA [Planctomycetes bacterium]|nr:potassium transporter TrkA [Planctomycetota bacterium]
MISLIVLAVIIVLSSIAVKTGAIALRLTGLDEETANFQALSAWTNTGFTTREAERMVNHPTRRRVIKMLIIMGNAGIVSIIAALIRSFSEDERTTDTLIRLSLLGVGLYVLYRLAIASRVKKIIDRFIEKRLSFLPSLQLAEFQQILSLGGENAISYIEISVVNPIAELTLKQAALNTIKVLVLAVEREGESMPTPAASMVLHPKDRLVAYGSVTSMKLVAQGDYYPPGYERKETGPENEAPPADADSQS